MAAPEKELWSQLPLVSDVMKHPAFPTATWHLEPTREGLLPVAEGRGGPLKISWAVHGHGPVKMLFLMGLGSFKSAWQRQTLHFGHEHGDKYSVLTIDNRGMGGSDKPLMRYSTSEMARDTIEVLAHIGWLPSHVLSPQSSPTQSTPHRTLHVLGISMGGMIAQEVAYLIPEYVSTLNLLCTAAAIENTTTFWENMMQRAQMLVPKSLEASVRNGAENMFPLPYLRGADDIHLPNPSATPKIHPPGGKGGQGEYLHFRTNYERFVAGEMHKRLDANGFTTKGFLLQLIAAGWHHKSREQLQEMAVKIGRDRILVLHGEADRMITVPHGRKLLQYLGGQEGPGLMGIIRPDMGHVPALERTAWFNELIEERVWKGEKLDGRPGPWQMGPSFLD